jgi:Ca2+-binding RTX toxin-like protein
MSLLSGFDVSLNEIRVLGDASRAAFAGGSVPVGWNVVTPGALGLGGQYQDGNYFRGGSSGASAIVLRQGNEYIVSFRGTDGADDVSRYFELYTGQYINHFAPLLNALAAQAPSDATFSFTGASLGGGATNLMAKIAATAFEGRFADATFVAFASPNITNAQGILNIGFENDPVYKAVGLYKDFSSSLDNLVLATAEYMAGNTNGRDPFSMSAHTASVGFEAVSRLAASAFYDLMRPDSVVVFDATGGLVQDSTPGRSRASVFYLGENVGDHIAGRDGKDYIEGFGGNDVLNGGKGNDQIRGGAGDDRLLGGAGKDILLGDLGADTYVFAASGTKNIDQILDYDFNQGDRIDLSALLDANFGQSSLVTDFVRVISSGENFLLQIDADGLSGGAKFAGVATLSGYASNPSAQVLVFFEQQAQQLTV